MSLDRTLNSAIIALTICITLITATVVKREFFPAAQAPQRSALPKRIPGWREYASTGASFGPANAPLTIVEFSDFQCPACRQFARSVKALRARYPGQIRLVYRHYPLERIHPHAFAAAMAAECAGEQGRFEFVHDRLFQAQDSLGFVSWSSIAAKAGVRSLAQFERCMRDSVATARIRADMAIGDQLHVEGTPTVLFNDLLVTGALPDPQLDSLTRAATVSIVP